MCGEMGKAVLRALTGALLCGLVSDAAYLQNYDTYPVQYEQAVYRKPLREHEKPQRFSCAHVPVHPGMYANVETGCQAYHVCHDGREGHQGAAFLCTNGTLFDQTKFACDWWYNVDCSQAIEHYKLNADPLKNPYVPKPKKVEVPEHGVYYKHD
ncbi:PREDICTED: uncharacterized protein LOC106104955 [Papilio polytes]|uniref:uncharacterized protein LOC106104955 n=1 Tax=Papilio polytes TaxID=76194 RepID=UPI0006765E35|nr:PREDICTED: uncharacterized protein LOC106104955 [Papilio polytes]